MKKSKLLQYVNSHDLSGLTTKPTKYNTKHSLVHIDLSTVKDKLSLKRAMYCRAPNCGKLFTGLPIASTANNSGLTYQCAHCMGTNFIPNNK